VKDLSRLGIEPQSPRSQPQHYNDPHSSFKIKGRIHYFKFFIREDAIRNMADASEGKDEIVNNPESHRLKKRYAVDTNGHRILRVVKRDTTEMADVETTEKVIQVIKQ